MFYEQLVLARDGPLAVIWLASHWEKKLTKKQVMDTSIVATAAHIKNPKVQMALRLSGHLLLGLSRIYYKKVEIVYDESNEALVKIKVAFRPGTVDMDESVANLTAITMPETFGEFEVILPSYEVVEALPEVEEGLFTLNLARIVDITITPPETEIVRQAESELQLSDFLSVNDISTLQQEMTLLDPSKPEFEMQKLPEEVPLIAMAEPLEEPSITRPSWEDITTVLEREPPIKVPELPPAKRRRKRYAFDKRTELSLSAMRNTIDDPRSLLRPLTRAPPTRELINLHQITRDEGPTVFFHIPMDDSMAPQLQDLVKRTMHPEDIELLQVSGELEIQRGEGPPIGEELPPIIREEHELPVVTEWPEISIPSVDTTIQITGPSITEEAERPEGLVITKRTASMHEFLARKFAEGMEYLSFFSLFQGVKRRTVAMAFFEILNIRSKNCIYLEQHENWDDIIISKTSSFEHLIS